MTKRIFPQFYIETLSKDLNLKSLNSEFGCGHVLFLVPSEDEVKKFNNNRDFKQLKIIAKDSVDQDLTAHFLECLKFIEEGRKDDAVIVVCSTPKYSLSGAICIAYIVSKLKITLKEAYELVRDAVPNCRPNDSFVKQLKTSHELLTSWDLEKLVEMDKKKIGGKSEQTKDLDDEEEDDEDEFSIFDEPDDANFDQIVEKLKKSSKPIVGTKKENRNENENENEKKTVIIEEKNETQEEKKPQVEQSIEKNEQTQTQTQTQTTSNISEPISNPNKQEIITNNNNNNETQTQIQIQQEEETPVVVKPPSKEFYCCKMCRTILLDGNDILTHEAGQGQNAFGWYKRNKDNGLNENEVPINSCSSIFVERKEWMGSMSEIEGKLVCPKCLSKLGSFKWAGDQCSCGAWQTPFIQIQKAKVDVKIKK